MRGAAGLPPLLLYVFRAWTGKTSTFIPLSHLLGASSTFIGIKYLHFLYDWRFHPILVISLFNIRPRNRMSRRVFLVILSSSSEQMATQHIKLEHGHTDSTHLNSLFTDHSIIRRFSKRAIKNVVKSTISIIPPSQIFELVRREKYECRSVQRR